MKKLTAIVLIALTVFLHIPFSHAESLNIDAEACILIDSKAGQVLYEQNADRERLYPASTTKVMTALLALEKGDLDQMMTASEAAVNDIGKDGMNIGIMTGEEISLDNLLNALLISSANETSNIIAENICSTRKEFVDMMNSRAKELGAVHTHFENPCGAHDSDHYTTARDLATIARQAMTIPKFRDIVRKTQYKMADTNKHTDWPVLYTTNKLMRRNKNELFDVIGIKTGFTVPAGYNLISSAVNKDGMELIAVVMGVKNPSLPRDSVYNFSDRLLEYGFENYSLQKLIEGGKVISNIPVTGADDENITLDVVAKGDLSVVLPNDTSNRNISRKEYIKSSVEAPVNKGDVLGYIEYQINGIVLGKVELIASGSIEKAHKVELIDTVETVIDNSLFRKVAVGALLLLVAFILLRITLQRISRKVRSRRYGNRNSW